MGEPQIKYDPRYTFKIYVPPDKNEPGEYISVSTTPRECCDILMDQMLDPKRYKMDPAQYKLPKQYQAGKNYDEITAVKTILNIWLPSKSKLTINNTFDGDLSAALKAFSIIYGIPQSKPGEITRAHILALKKINGKKFTGRKTSEGKLLYNYIKQSGLQKGMKKFAILKKGKIKKSLDGNKHGFYGHIDISTAVALKKLCASHQFNADKIIKKVMDKQMLFGCDPDTVVLAIVEASNKYGVSPRIIASLIDVESNWDPGSISKLDAYGLMQTTRPAHDEVVRVYGVSYKNYQTDIRENILCGAAYFKISLNELKDMNLAIAGYNAGWPAIKINKGIPPGSGYNETRDFVPKVLNAYHSYT